MYMYVKNLAATTLPLIFAGLLSACGGAPADEPASNPSSLANKPQASSIEASSLPSSAQSSISSPIATSASTTSITASSAASSEPTDSYSRTSRINSSHGTNSSVSIIGSDNIPPNSTKLLLYRLSENSITLVWDSAVDNIGISHYEIERDGSLLASVDHSVNVMTDQQLFAHTDYRYTITAFDTEGNKSEKSPAFTVRTLANANSSKSISSTPRSTASSTSSSTSNANSSVQSTSSVSSSNAADLKSAKLTWVHPNQRENGDYLELDDIGGYEIRYRKITDNRFTYILINGNKVTEYTHADANDMEFEIATFDTNGVYSRFVKVTK